MSSEPYKNLSMPVPQVAFSKINSGPNDAVTCVVKKSSQKMSTSIRFTQPLMRTPVLPQPELSRLGFQLILYPLTGLYASAKALETTFTHLQVNGTTAGHEDRLISFERFNELIGVEQKYAKADKYTRKED
jgi:2-methylisocitrate lyase-like PEP mutase family enzyme